MSETSSESYYARITKPRRKIILSLIFKETPDAQNTLKQVLSIRPSLLFPGYLRAPKPATSTRRSRAKPRPRNSPGAVLRISLAEGEDGDRRG
jgi:hypothetical protein